MRLRREQHTPVQPDVQATLQDYSDSQRGRRIQSPMRRRTIKAVAFIATAAAGIGAGNLLGDKGVGAHHKSSEQVKAEILQAEKAKRTGFYCELSSVVVGSAADLSTSARGYLSITIKGTNHARILAPVFHEDTRATGPEQIAAIEASGKGNAESEHTVIATVPAKNYDERIGLYAVTDDGVSKRCINGLEFVTHDPQGNPVNPEFQIVGIGDLPDQWTQ